MRPATSPRVLALYASYIGIGFVFFDGNALPEWRIKRIRGVSATQLRFRTVKKLLEHFAPDVLVLEDTSVKTSRRDKRVHALYAQIARFAKEEGVQVKRYTQERVFEYFQAHKKDDVSLAVVGVIPALAPRLPRMRRNYMSEHPRQAIFDAAALGILHIAMEKPEEGAAERTP